MSVVLCEAASLQDVLHCDYVCYVDLSAADGALSNILSGVLSLLNIIVEQNSSALDSRCLQALT